MVKLEKTDIVIICMSMVLVPLTYYFSARLPLEIDDQLYNWLLFIVGILFGARICYKRLFELELIGGSGGSNFEELWKKGKKLLFVKEIFLSIFLVALFLVFIRVSLVSLLGIPTKYFASQPFVLKGTCENLIQGRRVGTINYFNIEERAEPFKLMGYQAMCQLKDYPNHNDEIKCTLKGREWVLGRYVDELACTGGKEMKINRQSTLLK